MIGPLKTILLNFEPKTAFLRQFLAFYFLYVKNGHMEIVNMQRLISSGLTE